MHELVSRLKRAILAGMALGPVVCAASGPLPPYDDARQAELSLQFGRADTMFRYGATAVDTRVDQASVFVRQRFGGSLHLGMLGGATALAQTGSAATAGLTLDGYHAGLTLEIEFVTRRSFALFGSVGYVYQSVKSSRDMQSVDLSWDEWRARLGAALALGPVRVFGGAARGSIDGIERTTGTINQTARFSARGSTRAFGGLDLRVDPDGYIGIERRGGIDEGFLIYFRRRF